MGCGGEVDVEQRGYVVAAVLGIGVVLSLVLADLPITRAVTTDGADAHVRTAGMSTGTPQAADALARDVFDRVNRERGRRGLHPVVWDDELAQRAGRWSTHMTTAGFEHSDGAFRATDDYPGTGENIALGQLDTGELHVGWMRSDGHRYNILAAEARALGVGIVCRGDGSMWATQIFGFPPAGTAPFLPPPGWTDQPPVEPIAAPERGLRCPPSARRP